MSGGLFYGDSLLVEYYESLVEADPFETIGKLPAMLNPQLISAVMKELLVMTLDLSSELQT